MRRLSKRNGADWLPFGSACASVSLASLLLLISGCQGVGDGGGGVPSFSRLDLRQVSGKVGVDGEYRDERRKGVTTDIRRKETLLREKVELQAQGSYYHSKLLDFDLSGSFGLEQRDIRSRNTGVEENIDGRNLSYDAFVRLFKDLPWSGEIYSYRHETQSRQTFFATTEAVVSEEGFSVSGRELPIPSTLHAHHYRYRGRGLNFYSETRNTLSLEGRMTESDQQYNYLAEISRVDLGTLPSDFTDAKVNVSAVNFFGPEYKDRLFNSFAWRKQTGALGTENLLASSSYHAQWSEVFSSDHGLQYTQSTASSLTTQTLQLTSGVTHRLYSSLVSTLSGRYGATRFGQGSIDTFGANASLNYSKQLPIGRLNMSYLADTYIQDRGNLQGIVAVLDEVHVNTPGSPIFLQNRAVILTSIVVTDASGLIVYTLGSDYFATQVASQVRIDIPITSLINPGDTILVDYNFEPTPQQKSRTLAQDASIRLAIMDWVDLMFSLGNTNQTLLSGVDDGTLEDFRRKSAAVHLHQFGASLGLDYEDLDSTQVPFEQIRYSAAYQDTLFDVVNWRTTASYFRTYFKGEAETERGTSAGATLSSNLGDNLTFDLRGEYRNFSLRTDEGRGYLLEASIRKAFRNLEASLNVRFSDEKFLIADDQRTTWIFLAISRTF